MRPAAPSSKRDRPQDRTEAETKTVAGERSVQTQARNDPEWHTNKNGRTRTMLLEFMTAATKSVISIATISKVAGIAGTLMIATRPIVDEIRSR